MVDRLVSYVIPTRIVLDTNVLVAGLMSQMGASFQILQLVGRDRFELQLSVSLFLEYEAVAKRMSREIGLEHKVIDDVLDFLVLHSKVPRIHFLWRPFLSDPSDDMILELAVASQAAYIVTHNVADFRNVEQFHVKAITPKVFLKELNNEYN